LKHFTQLKYFLYFLFLTLLHLFLSNIFLFKSLPQGLYRSEHANSNKLISRCYLAMSLRLWDTVKFPPDRRKTKGDRKQASYSERTKMM